jgi:hypothetical protein
MVSRHGIRALPAILAIVALAGCSGTTTPSPSSSQAPSPVGTVQPTARVTPSPTASPAPTPSPSPTPAPTPTPATTPSPTSAAGFTCSRSQDIAASTSANAFFVQDVRVGAHAAYDRIVFEFTGKGTPALSVERVKPPFEKDPSGLPLMVPGTSFIQIRMVQTSGAGYARPDGDPTYTGPTSFRLNGARLTSLVQQGDFEGYFTWIAGLTGPMCVRITRFSNPARIAIDLRAP